MESPCVRVCKLNKEDICIGCKRTREEIGQWMSYSSLQREIIIKKLKERIVNE